MKSINISVKIDFPPEVDLDNLEDKEYNINDLSDFQELLFEYKRTKMRGGYLSLNGKDEQFRWVFFLDTYEAYSDADTNDLMIDPVFKQKWYKNKYMTAMVLDENLNYHRRVVPASKDEYVEEKELFDKLYTIFKNNQDFIGKYIKRKKKDN